MLHSGSNCSLALAMDGRIMRCGIISSCQSVATSEIVKRSWACVHSAAALHQVPDLYLYLYLYVSKSTHFRYFRGGRGTDTDRQTNRRTDRETDTHTGIIWVMKSSSWEREVTSHPALHTHTTAVSYSSQTSRTGKPSLHHKELTTADRRHNAHSSSETE